MSDRGDKTPKENWFRTDVGPHFADCCKFLNQQTEAAILDVRSWQWAFVGAGALSQSAAVLFLCERSTTSLNTLSKKSASDWMSAYLLNESAALKGKMHLAKPRDLLKRVRKMKELQNFDNYHGRILDTLNFRNDFVHFTPKGWSIEMSGAPKLILGSIEFALDILNNPGDYALNYLPQDEREPLKILLSSIQIRLSKSSP